MMERSDIEKLICGIRKEDAFQVAHAILIYAKTGKVPEPFKCQECGILFYKGAGKQQFCAYKCQHRSGQRRRYRELFHGYSGKINR